MADQPMKFGVATPVTSMHPRRQVTWERDAGPDDLKRIAVAADDLGYYWLTCPEHVGIPTEVAKIRGARYYDPLATLSYFAAVTSQIKLFTTVIALGYHHPLAVAKRYGTLDKLSNGRLVLGVGVGSLREEFDLLGAEFDNRGAVYTDALKALRAALGQHQPKYEGEFYTFDDFIIDPHAVQERVPIWLGGRTALSLRRALTSGQGWDPFGLTTEQAAELIGRARSWPEWTSRTEPFGIALTFEPALDITQPGQIDVMVDNLGRLQAAGATVYNAIFRSESVEHYLEQLALFQEKVAPRFA